MTDPTRPTERDPEPGSERDQELAALLAVPALDDVTRRRLVRTAVEATTAEPISRSPRSKHRLGAAVGVAAALVVGAIVGAVVVTRPSDETPTAARASSTTNAPAALDSEAAAPAPQSGEDQVSAEDPAGAPPQELGDLGIVSGVSSLRGAIEDRFQQGGAASEQPPTAVTGCRDASAGALGLVAVSATGEAQLAGRPVAVLVGPTPQGAEQAVVLDPASDCAVVERFDL